MFIDDSIELLLIELFKGLNLIGKEGVSMEEGRWGCGW